MAVEKETIVISVEGIDTVINNTKKAKDEYAAFVKGLTEQTKKSTKDLEKEGIQVKKLFNDYKRLQKEADKLKQKQAKTIASGANTGGSGIAGGSFTKNLSKNVIEGISGNLSGAALAATGYGAALLALNKAATFAADGLSTLNTIAANTSKVTAGNAEAFRTVNSQLATLSTLFSVDADKISKSFKRISESSNVASTDITAFFKRALTDGANFDVLDGVLQKGEELGLTFTQTKEILESVEFNDKFDAAQLENVSKAFTRLQGDTGKLAASLNKTFDNDFGTRLATGVKNGAISASAAVDLFAKEIGKTGISAAKAQQAATELFGEYNDGIVDSINLTAKLVQDQTVLDAAIGKTTGKVDLATKATETFFKSLEGIRKGVEDAFSGVLPIFESLIDGLSEFADVSENSLFTFSEFVSFVTQAIFPVLGLVNVLERGAIALGLLTKRSNEAAEAVKRSKETNDAYKASVSDIAGIEAAVARYEELSVIQNRSAEQNLALAQTVEFLREADKSLVDGQKVNTDAFKRSQNQRVQSIRESLDRQILLNKLAQERLIAEQKNLAPEVFNAEFNKLIELNNALARQKDNIRVDIEGRVLDINTNLLLNATRGKPLKVKAEIEVKPIGFETQQQDAKKAFDTAVTPEQVQAAADALRKVIRAQQVEVEKSYEELTKGVGEKKAELEKSLIDLTVDRRLNTTGQVQQKLTQTLRKEFGDFINKEFGDSEDFDAALIEFSNNFKKSLNGIAVDNTAQINNIFNELSKNVGDNGKKQLDKIKTELLKNAKTGLNLGDAIIGTAEEERLSEILGGLQSVLERAANDGVKDVNLLNDAFSETVNRILQLSTVGSEFGKKFAPVRKEIAAAKDIAAEDLRNQIRAQDELLKSKANSRNFDAEFAKLQKETEEKLAIATENREKALQSLTEQQLKLNKALLEQQFPTIARENERLDTERQLKELEFLNEKKRLVEETNKSLGGEVFRVDADGSISAIRDLQTEFEIVSGQAITERVATLKTILDTDVAALEKERDNVAKALARRILGLTQEEFELILLDIQTSIDQGQAQIDFDIINFEDVKKGFGDLNKLTKDQTEQYNAFADQLLAKELALSDERINKIQLVYAKAIADTLAAGGDASQLIAEADVQLQKEVNVRLQIEQKYKAINSSAKTTLEKLQEIIAKYTPLVQAASQLFSQVGDLFIAIEEARIAEIDGEIERIQSNAEKLAESINDIENDLEGKRSGRREAVLAALELQKRREADLAKQQEALERKKAEREKAAARIRKAQAIKDAIINNALAITNIIATTPKADFGVATGILIGLYGAIGATQVATIAAQETFADGGFTGDGLFQDHTGHKVAGVVHDNEYVVPKWIVKSPKYAPMVNALEEVRTKGYADGGLVGAQNASTAVNNGGFERMMFGFAKQALELANRPIYANPIEFNAVANNFGRRVEANTIGG